MNRKRGFLPKLKRIKWTEIALGFLCTFFILTAQFFNIPGVTPLIKQLDGQIYDQVIKLNTNNNLQNPHVVIINIDEKSVQREGRWPWPRDKMARLIQQLKQNGVVTIGMDIVMSEAEINYALGLKNKLLQLNNSTSDNQNYLITSLDKIAGQVDNDQAFAQSLLDHNVVLSFLFHNEPEVQKGKLPSPLIITHGLNAVATKTLYEFQGYNGSLDLFTNTAKQAGFVTNLPDKDGTVRHSFIIAKHNNKLYPSLSLATAINYLLIDNVNLVTRNKHLYGVQIDGIFIPTNSYGQILIPFWGKPGTLDYYSATDILNNKIHAQELEGSIAIIGSTMTLLSDLHQSPVSQLFPGVEMVGNMIQGMISQQLTSEYNWYTTQALICFILFGLILAILYAFFGIFGKMMLTLITLIGISGGVITLFLFRNLYVPSAFLFSLVLLQTLVSYIYSFIIERRQKIKINQLFGQYVPKDYVQELIEYPEHYKMDGQTRNMTVQFADIRNFTTISETLNAVKVKKLLNTFFTPITEIIFNHRGTIDKYVGDMIVAFWGAPLKDKEHAYHAIMSALTVFKQLPEINEKLCEKDLPPVNIGIGLASGLMNVGDMGSEFRRAYTVLGDTVNLASRLQDLTKFYQVNILVNDLTRDGQDAFIWRPVDKVIVKGRKSALTIYQPLGIVTDVSSEQIEELEEYKLALDDYYAQNWTAAEKKFTRLKKLHSETYLYLLYLQRIKSFKTTPPPKHWDGVYMHHYK